MVAEDNLYVVSNKRFHSLNARANNLIAVMSEVAPHVARYKTKQPQVLVKEKSRPSRKELLRLLVVKVKNLKHLQKSSNLSDARLRRRKM